MRDDYREYVEAGRRRFALARREDEARAARALEAARRVAVLLVREFRASRVTLVGSLAVGAFGSRSDIDLVVEDLPPARFFAACARADREAGEFAVDLVPVECAGDLMRRRVATEGKVLADAAHS